MSESLAFVNELLDTLFAEGPVWVYLAIFLACFIENITPPFPGDSFIVAAGGLVAVARLEPVFALAAVVFGGMSSVMLIYFAGRRYGRDFFIRKDYRYFSARDILAVEARFEKQGVMLLVASRFIVGFRVLLALAAGMGRYPIGKMIVFSTVSYLLFSGLLMYAGFKLVEHVDTIAWYFKTYSTVAWSVVIGVVLLYLVHRFRQLKKRGAA